MANEKRLIEYGSAVGQIQKLHMDAFRRRDKAQSEAYQKAWDVLMDAPTVDAVEVVHGHMVERIVDHECPWYTVFDCSECGCSVERWHNYCPNCGAKMDGDGNG